jgi:transcriptional regulator with XRE-family HTH domain
MSWHDLITEARNKRGISQAKLAKAIGVSQAIIGKIENHQVESTKILDRLITFFDLERDAFPPEAFGIPDFTKDLQAFGAAQARQPLPEFARDPAYWAAAVGLVGDVPLYASAEGGAGSLIIERDPIGTEKRPHALQGVKGGYAIFIVGESMVPEIEPGDTLFINPKMPVLQNTSCVFYSNKNEEPTATVKRYLRDGDGTWIVRQFNPAREFELDKSEWAVRHRIVSKKFR